MKENQTIDPKKEIPNKEDKHMDYFWNACVPEERAEIIVSIREKVFQKIRQIDPSLAKKHSTRRIVWLSTAIAASLLLGVWTIKWVLTEKSSVDIRLLAQQMEMNVEKVPEQVTLIVSEKKKIQIGETAQIKYDHSGGLTVDEKNVNEKESKKESQLLQYNQLIVPKGKRSKVQLSDGTEMWVNSGSKVIYPRVFKGNKREIFVDGEVYLDVTSDHSKPFLVKTPNLEVRVLGTSFNVFSYSHLTKSQVVLATGSVELKDTEDETILMKPNELVEVTDQKIELKKEVDAQVYTSWTKGIWVMDGITLKELSERLQFYYGKNIHCDATVENELLYGKLDLREHVEEIVDFVQSILPVKAKVEENEIYFYSDL